MVFIIYWSSTEMTLHCILGIIVFQTFWDVYHNQDEKWKKLKNYFFRKTRNGKLIIWKLIIMYLSISKQTHWDAYSNQDEWNKCEK